MIWKSPGYSVPCLLQSLLVRITLQESQGPETSGKVWSDEDLPSAQEAQVSKHLNQFDTQKSRRPDVMDPGALRELASVVARPLSVSFEGHGDWGRFLRTGRK